MCLCKHLNGRKKKEQSPTRDVASDPEAKRLSELYGQATRTISQKDRIILDQKDEISRLTAELNSLKKQNRLLTNAIKKINALSGSVTA